ncbi:MAG: D-alanyl-D-alanine carboxypeptidase/D-alanyl-D-alanine-endopeptidase [Planctomycetota bacterium]
MKSHGAILLTYLLTALAAAPAPAAVGTSPAVRAYLARHDTTVTYCAVRLADGRVIAARRARRPMVPASVQKVCTSAVALDVLGETFAFRTRLAVHEDDVFVVGDGDPTLGDPHLAEQAGGTIYDTPDRWARVLRDRGLRRVDGHIVLDDDIFQERRHADWPEAQHQRWYCAPVSGLNFNDNCLDIRIELTDGRPAVTLSPACSRLTVVNQLRRGSDQLWRVAYADDDRTVTLTGTVRTSMTEPLSVAVNEPSLLLGRVFADRLARAGVTGTPPVVRARVASPDRTLPGQLTVVAEQVTPLAKVLRRANKRSLNLAAECLLLRAAVERTSRGSFKAAANLARAILVERYGVAPDQITVADGSGMSRANRLSAEAAVTILRRLAAEHPTFLDSLAAAGADGTLRKRLTDARGRVRAKTGTLAGVVTLAGYILDDDGAPVVAMAIFCNNVRGGNGEARRMIDALVAEWIDATAGRAAE